MMWVVHSLHYLPTNMALSAMQDLAHTLRTRLVEHPRFVAPKRPQHAFGIEHYAGRVTYTAEYLLDKNKVCLPGSFTFSMLQTLISRSRSAIALILGTDIVEKAESAGFHYSVDL